MNRDELAEKLYLEMAHLMHKEINDQDAQAQACCAYKCADAFIAEKARQAEQAELKKAEAKAEAKAHKK